MSVISGPSGCGLPLGENGASMIRPGASFAFVRCVMRTTGACRSGRERNRSTAAGGSVGSGSVPSFTWPGGGRRATVKPYEIAAAVVTVTSRPG